MSELMKTVNEDEQRRVIAQSFQAAEEEGDTRDEEGFLVCGTCGKRKEADHDIEGKIYRFMAECDCLKARREAREAQERERREMELRLDLNRASGLSPLGLSHTFDTLGTPRRTADTARRYAEEFETMESHNVGMLFMGEVGTGKTFLAECIANALLEKLISVRFLSLPSYLQLSKEEMQKEKACALHSRLLILDDLGAERDSDFALEAVYDLIERRRGLGKPVLITTNLTKQDLKRADLQHSRVYDRVMEMCPAMVTMEGTSRRAEEAAARLTIAKTLIEDAEAEG